MEPVKQTQTPVSSTNNGANKLPVTEQVALNLVTMLVNMPVDSKQQQPDSIIKSVQCVLVKYDCKDLFHLLDNIAKQNVVLFPSTITGNINLMNMDLAVDIIKLTVIREIKKNPSLSKNVLHTTYNKDNVFYIELKIASDMCEKTSKGTVLLILASVLKDSDCFELAINKYEQFINTFSTCNSEMDKSYKEYLLGKSHYSLALCQVHLQRIKQAEQNHKTAVETYHYHNNCCEVGRLCMELFGKTDIKEYKTLGLNSFELESNIFKKKLLPHCNIGFYFLTEANIIISQGGDPTKELNLAAKSYHIVVSAFILNKNKDNDDNYNNQTASAFSGIAQVYLLCGQKKKAIEMLKDGIEHGDPKAKENLDSMPKA